MPLHCFTSILYHQNSPYTTSPQGLGTSTADEAKQYFANIQSHRKEFVWDGGWPAAGAWPVCLPQQL